MGLEQYRTLFFSESEEHLQNINAGVLELEKNPHNTKILHEIFRSVHTLKGMAATMGFDVLAKLSHRMEDVLDLLRAEKVPVTVEIVDVLFECLDRLEQLLEEIKNDRSEQSVDVDSMIQRLESLSQAKGAEEPPVAAVGAGGDWQRRITLSRVEADYLLAAVAEQSAEVLMLRVRLAADCQVKSVRVFMVMNKLAEYGEVVKTDPPVEDLEVNRFDGTFEVVLFSCAGGGDTVRAAVERILEVESAVVTPVNDVSMLVAPEERPATGSPEPDSESHPQRRSTDTPGQLREPFQQMGVRKIQSIRVSTTRLDKLMNLVGELVISKIRLMQIAQSQQNTELNEILTNIDRLSGDLQDEVMQARLIPMSQVFDRFPRMVRDLARSEKKQVNFEVSGGEIELDRTVLDEIADPLVHLLRNSVDHGIELPDQRKKVKKLSTGTIRLQALRERTHVLIQVSDDGKGIEPQTIRETAVRKGFMSSEDIAKLSDKDALNLIMLPGFSSAKQITDTSGRGVGMDVVKMKIESLGGAIHFDSTVGQGSCFTLKLPLTVAIIRAMLLRVYGEVYAVPIANIAETLLVSESKVRRIEKFEVITLRNEVLPLVRLGRILSDGSAPPAAPLEHTVQNISVVVVEGNGTRAGLVVDEVVGQQEVVIKQMSKHVKAIKGFAGATILGDGKVALILDVASLMGHRQ